MWLYEQYLKIRPTHFYHRDAVLYPSIPKNSSTIWRNRVFNNQSNIVNIDNLPQIAYAFAIIRDPAERLISGLQEWIKRSHRAETVEQIIDNFDYYAVWHQSVNDLNFYAHIMPQAYFVAEYDFELVEFNNQQHIADVIEQRKLSDYIVRAIRRNITTQTKTYEFVDDSRTTTIIKKYYKQDIDIWNKTI